jgi:hypothetical protein
LDNHRSAVMGAARSTAKYSTCASIARITSGVR